MEARTYLAVDLKSFYASVECVERGLDPMTTNLVVADLTRTEKTICLAVTPALKAYGIPGRARLFEVIQKVREINAHRRQRAPGHVFSGASSNDLELRAAPSLELDYIVAPPRMARYMEWSARIYQVYLRHVAPEDIHPYSIDEVFMDITPYLQTTGLAPWEFAKRVVKDVLDTTGITATAGIGPNLYLCKAALDIVSKHIRPDKDGVRIARLNELSYRQLLWSHRPITDFWRVGPGYAKRLAEHGIYTMGDIARCSLGGPGDLHNEDLLYKLFGINAELLIDHAWGWEPCTISDIKAYRPESNSIGSGQVLQCPYSAEKARIVIREMADALALELVEKGLATDQLTLTVGYDIENIQDPERLSRYRGKIKRDRYGRFVPKHSHGKNIEKYTSSTRKIQDAADALFHRIVDPGLLIRRLNITANHVMSEREVPEADACEQMDLFVDYEIMQEEKRREEAEQVREKKIQSTVLDIKRKFGKNAILKGTALEDGATSRERNQKIGGHQA